MKQTNNTDPVYWDGETWPPEVGQIVEEKTSTWEYEIVCCVDGVPIGYQRNWNTAFAFTNKNMVRQVAKNRHTQKELEDLSILQNSLFISKYQAELIVNAGFTYQGKSNA